MTEYTHIPVEMTDCLLLWRARDLEKDASRGWADWTEFTGQVKVTVKVTQSCPTLCDPMDYTVHGILQARILECVAFPDFRGSSQPRDQTQVSHIAGGFFTSWATREVGQDVYTKIWVWNWQHSHQGYINPATHTHTHTAIYILLTLR